MRFPEQGLLRCSVAQSPAETRYRPLQQVPGRVDVAVDLDVAMRACFRSGPTGPSGPCGRIAAIAARCSSITAKPGSGLSALSRRIGEASRIFLLSPALLADVFAWTFDRGLGRRWSPSSALASRPLWRRSGLRSQRSADANSSRDGCATAFNRRRDPLVARASFVELCQYLWPPRRRTSTLPTASNRQLFRDRAVKKVRRTANRFCCRPIGATWLAAIRADERFVVADLYQRPSLGRLPHGFSAFLNLPHRTPRNLSSFVHLPAL